MDTKNSTKLFRTTLNEETDSHNGSENHCRRMQKVGDSLGVANADRRREHMDSRTSKWRRIQQRRNARVEKVKGVRTIKDHNNKWSLWATKVRALAASTMTKKRSEASAMNATMEALTHGQGSTEERAVLSTIFGWKTYWVHAGRTFH
jgi:hypothetical protein